MDSKKKISFSLYKIISFVNLFLFKITNKDLLVHFQQFLRQNSYKTIKILKKKITFFVPNAICKYRVDTFFTKEPETLKYIDKFHKKKIIFWDIGSNIGLYSIYAAIKHKNIEIVSFEPSTANLQILSKNISINKLSEKIKICQIALSNKENLFLKFKESSFEEGGSHNVFGKNFNESGRKLKNVKNSYKIFGTSINFLLNKKILKVPNYIKIDVDGIEHLILSGASQHLLNLKLKSLIIEINENFDEQMNRVLSIMKQNKFKILYKKKSMLTPVNSKIFNYVFIR